MKHSDLYGLKRGNIEGISFDYVGTLPSKCVFIMGPKRAAGRVESDLYISSLEVALNGYEGLLLSGLTPSPILNGLFDGGARIHMVFPESIERTKRSRLTLPLLTGGSAIFAYDKSLSYYENFIKSALLAVYLTRAMIISSDYEKSSRLISGVSMDRHSGFGILKSSLIYKSMRRVSSESQSIVNSFSDLLSNPSSYIYPSLSGRYNYSGLSYGVFSYDKLEV